MSAPLEALSALERGLEQLLAGLEAGDLSARSNLDWSWAELERRFATVRACMDGNRAAWGAAVLERVERCLRLYAVTAGMLVTLRDGLTLERAACTAARQRIRGLRSAGEGGRSCDVRG
jgi:hypothetical protein